MRRARIHTLLFDIFRFTGPFGAPFVTARLVGSFNFTIPSNATIDGIQFNVSKRSANVLESKKTIYSFM